MKREFTESDLRWIKKFERVMKDAPSNLFMFVGAGITIYPERVMKSGNDGAGDVVDQTGESIAIITPMECDGGDY